MAEKTQPNRLFIALDLNEALQELIALRRPDIRGLRWVAPERLHLTLAFIGALPTELMQPLDEALERIRFWPFELELNRIGTFNQHTLWIGCDPTPALTELHGEIRSGLEALGLAPDPHPYTPHVTLGYSREPLHEHTIAQLDAELLPSAIPMQVDQFVLKNSILNAGNAPLHQVIRLYDAVPA